MSIIRSNNSVITYTFEEIESFDIVLCSCYFPFMYHEYYWKEHAVFLITILILLEQEIIFLGMSEIVWYNNQANE